jgi:calcineurin-like phosphoesterase family protein
MTKNVSLFASVALGVLLACVLAVLTAGQSAGQTRTATLVGAGDIASCSQKNDSATARLLGNISGTVFTLGDNVYPRGTAAYFRDCYDPTWGRYKKRTKPSLGNHEYYDKNFNMTTAAGPYFDYFGARAGARGKGYYSYDRGAWHVVVLNSNCGKVGGCESDSPQGRWLRNDLANTANHRCTMAYFHRPLYSTGTNVAGQDVKPFWRMLHDHGADLIVNGHAHRYERFAPMTPDGARSDASGIRQIVAGTGGAGGGDEISYVDAPNLQRVKTDAVGVLKLTLRADSYAWKFVPIAGKTFTDSGTTNCH